MKEGRRFIVQYILMNKNKPLCKIAIDEENHYIINDVIEVYSDKIAFPIGIDIISGKPQKKSLAKWWAGRAILGSRIGGHSFEMIFLWKWARLYLIVLMCRQIWIICRRIVRQMVCFLKNGYEIK